MPGNEVKINDSPDLNWYVGDKHIDELIKYLNKIGYREADG